MAEKESQLPARWRHPKWPTETETKPHRIGLETVLNGFSDPMTGGQNRSGARRPTAATDQLLSHVTAHTITVILCFKTEKTGTLCFQRIRRYPDRNAEQSQSGPQEPGRGRDSTGAGMRSRSNGRDRPGSVSMCRPGGNGGVSSGLRVMSCHRGKMMQLRPNFVTVHRQD